MANDETILPAWATAPSKLKLAIDGEVECEPVEITEESVIQNLYIEAKDRDSKSPVSYTHLTLPTTPYV